MATIQLKVAGSWRNVLSVNEENIDLAHAVVQGTLRALRIMVAPRLLREDGQEVPVVGAKQADDWRPITDSDPAPLHDVMVSAYDSSESEAVVFMAWRSNSDPSRWLISGSDELLLLPVYAYCEVMAAAVAPKELSARMEA